jgi:hypothetical protein
MCPNKMMQTGIRGNLFVVNRARAASAATA